MFLSHVSTAPELDLDWDLWGVNINNNNDHNPSAATWGFVLHGLQWELCALEASDLITRLNTQKVSLNFGYLTALSPVC